MYHRQWIDKAIYGYLHRWMRRRHPNKPMTWIRQRYYRRIGTRSVFHTYVETKHGGQRRLNLMQIGNIPIKRHVKVQAGATPFDPRYVDYFKHRWARQSNRRKTDRRHLSLVNAPWQKIPKRTPDAAGLPSLTECLSRMNRKVHVRF